ncbi:MAG: rod shape-determining protein RodA [Saprospiraceae bacterium]|nr:rod shape-determining protein RodA [Saprospiraceae bacterium]
MLTHRTKPASRSIDWITFSLYLSLVFIGWLMIFAAEYNGDGAQTFTPSSIVGKQTIWIAASFVSLLILLNIDWKFWRNFAYPIYVISILSLIAVLVFGIEVKGARSWFSLFGFTLQPAELAKFSTALALASFLSGPTSKLKDFKNVLIAFAIFLLPMSLILLQPDAGSALVFISFLILLFREGLSPIPYVLAGVAATIFVLSLLYSPIVVIILLTLVAIFLLLQNLEHRLYWNLSLLLLAVASVICVDQGLSREILIINTVLLLFFLFFQWAKGKVQLAVSLLVAFIFCIGLSFGTDYAFNNVLEQHQQDRINVWLHPDKSDPQGPLYNVLLSNMAIGSGGLTGKGYLKGTLTKLNYVPEQSTDFIFCTVGEEQGFVGSLAIIGLFIFLIIRIIDLAERQRLNLFRNFGYGVAGILFFHFVINIGMTMGLLPIIGIPLPFVSYGGSSLLAFSFMIAILLKFDSQRYLN